MRQLVKTLFTLYLETKLFQDCEQINPSIDKYYPYIPSDSSDIIHVFEDLTSSKIKTDDKRFLDAGCGMPIIPSLAHLILGCKADGLEYNQAVIDKVSIASACKPFFQEHYPKRGVYLAPIFQGDILTFDYKEYDIIYTYNPIRDCEIMTVAIDQMVKTMKKGAVLYFQKVYRFPTDYLKELGFTEVMNYGMGGIFKFVKS